MSIPKNKNRKTVHQDSNIIDELEEKGQTTLLKKGRGGYRPGAGRKKSNNGEGTDKAKHALYCSTSELRILRVVLEQMREQNYGCTIREASLMASERADEDMAKRGDGIQRYYRGHKDKLFDN